MQRHVRIKHQHMVNKMRMGGLRRLRQLRPANVNLDSEHSVDKYDLSNDPDFLYNILHHH
jgi:hypothetical protein